MATHDRTGPSAGNRTTKARKRGIPGIVPRSTPKPAPRPGIQASGAAASSDELAPLPPDWEERKTLALEATWEIGALVGLLLSGSKQSRNDGVGFDPDVLRGVCLRMLDLNSVVMSVLGGDDAREVIEMASVVYGPEPADN